MTTCPLSVHTACLVALLGLGGGVGGGFKQCVLSEGCPCMCTQNSCLHHVREACSVSHTYTHTPHTPHTHTPTYPGVPQHVSMVMLSPRIRDIPKSANLTGESSLGLA